MIGNCLQEDKAKYYNLCLEIDEAQDSPLFNLLKEDFEKRIEELNDIIVQGLARINTQQKYDEFSESFLNLTKEKEMLNKQYLNLFDKDTIKSNLELAKQRLEESIRKEAK